MKRKLEPESQHQGIGRWQCLAWIKSRIARRQLLDASSIGLSCWSVYHTEHHVHSSRMTEVVDSLRKLSKYKPAQKKLKPARRAAQQAVRSTTNLELRYAEG